MAEQKAEHAEKKAAKKAEREGSARGLFHRSHDGASDENASPSATKGEHDDE